jgi:hypothetical protein
LLAIVSPLIFSLRNRVLGILVRRRNRRTAQPRGFVGPLATLRLDLLQSGFETQPSSLKLGGKLIAELFDGVVKLPLQMLPRRHMMLRRPRKLLLPSLAVFAHPRGQFVGKSQDALKMLSLGGEVVFEHEWILS